MHHTQTLTGKLRPRPPLACWLKSGSILLGARGFDWVAGILEEYYIAQPTVAVIIFAFLLHALMASRRIPAQLRERKAMQQLAKGLRDAARGCPTVSHGAPAFQPHLESMLWIWQLRTGMVMLVLGIIFAGIATPVEAAGVGTFGAIVVAARPARLPTADRPV